MAYPVIFAVKESSSVANRDPFIIPKCFFPNVDLSKCILISQKAAIKYFADAFIPLVDYRDVSELKILIIQRSHWCWVLRPDGISKARAGLNDEFNIWWKRNNDDKDELVWKAKPETVEIDSAFLPNSKYLSSVIQVKIKYGFDLDIVTGDVLLANMPITEVYFYHLCLPYSQWWSREHWDSSP